MMCKNSPKKVEFNSTIMLYSSALNYGSRILWKLLHFLKRLQSHSITPFFTSIHAYTQICPTGYQLRAQEVHQHGGDWRLPLSCCLIFWSNLSSPSILVLQYTSWKLSSSLSELFFQCSRSLVCCCVKKLVLYSLVVVSTSMQARSTHTGNTSQSKQPVLIATYNFSYDFAKFLFSQLCFLKQNLNHSIYSWNLNILVLRQQAQLVRKIILINFRVKIINVPSVQLQERLLRCCTVGLFFLPLLTVMLPLSFFWQGFIFFLLLSWELQQYCILDLYSA